MYMETLQHGYAFHAESACGHRVEFGLDFRGSTNIVLEPGQDAIASTGSQGWLGGTDDPDDERMIAVSVRLGSRELFFIWS